MSQLGGMENTMAATRVGFSRNMARTIIKKHGITSRPVDVSAIARAEGFTVLEITGPSEKWSGNFYHTTKTIAVNAAHHEHRKRFTIAHELGHFFLKHKSNNFEDDVSSHGSYESGIPGSDSRLSDFDHEADEFASELLIPLAMIKNDHAETNDAKQLAARYNVSEAAMWISLLKHGLIK
jgi:Zn-dependent peptidase ImmA (M78 family)